MKPLSIFRHKLILYLIGFIFLLQIEILHNNMVSLMCVIAYAALIGNSVKKKLCTLQKYFFCCVLTYVYKNMIFL